MLTRAEMSKTLGISKTTLRRWEDKGKLKPIVDPAGVHLFRKQDALALNGGKPIERLPKARALVPSAANAGGELAAEIYDRLDRQVHPVDIVKELRVHPDVVNGFASLWSTMRNVLMVPSDERVALERLLRMNGVGKGPDLVGNVKKALANARTPCRGCEESRPIYCKDCVNQHVARVKKKMRWLATQRAGRRALEHSDVGPSPPSVVAANAEG